MFKVYFNFRHFLTLLAIVSFLVGFSVVFTENSYAAYGVPRTINFQGRLVTNPGGVNVANGTVSIYFALYNGASGGTPLWSETQGSVTVTDGIFRVALGASTPIPASVNFNWDGLYLGINVNSNGEMTPRIQMASVPFAFNAQQVAGLTVQDTSGNASTSGTLQVANGATVKLPGSGTGLIYADSGASGNLASLNNSTTQTAQESGLYINLGSTASYNQYGIQFNLSAPAGYGFDLYGTGGKWYVSNAGDITVHNLTINGTCSGCGAGGGTNYWNLISGIGVPNGGYITPINSTADLLIGGQSTASAIFAFTGLVGNQTQASFSGQFIIMPNKGYGGNLGISTATPTAMLDVAGTASFGGQLTFRSTFGTIQTTADQQLTLGGSTTGKILLAAFNGPALASGATGGIVFAGYTGSGAGCTLKTDASGNVTCSTDLTGYSPFQELNGAILSNNSTMDFLFGSQATVSARFRVTANILGAGTLVVASISGQTSFATLVVNNNGVGDLFTASASGWTRFTIQGNGNIIDTSATAVNFSNAALTVASCTGCGLNYWGLNNGLLYNGNLTTDFAIGGTSSTSAKFLISQSGTMPTASVSARTSFAGLVVDQAGVGDIFTASAAGATRFRIAQNGSILMQGQTIASVGVGGTNTTSGSVINAIGDQGSLVPNAGFESNISGIGLSDGWVVDASNGATQVISRVATISAKGIFSIQVKLNASQSTAFYSTCIPLALSVAANYNLNFYVKTSSTSRVVLGYLDGYTSKQNCQSNTTPVFTLPQATGTSSTTAWYTLGSGSTAIPVMTGSQTWGRVHIFVGCPASCSAGTVVNIDGVRLIETTNAVGLDYAENYPADPNNIPQAGDVVSVESSGGSAQVAPSNQFMDNAVIGVISTNPGQVLDDGSVPDPKVTVALAGRTPVKVSSKNGPIQIGDYLASSDIPGVAVKATMAGPVIGTAMENYTDPDPQSIGKIVVFIKNTYFNGVSIASSSGLSLDGKDSSVILAMVKDSANSSNSISLSLTKDGQFAIKDGNGNSVITFDNQGNAFFKGLIVADKIKANQIEGLDIFANRIAALEAKTAVLSDATGSAELATVSASLPPALTLTSLSVDGLATVSGDLTIQGNGFIQGALNVLDNITTNNLLVSQFAYFINDVVFKGNVRFDSSPTFNSDTAGFAVIKKDSNSVQINFNQEYVNMPVVTASIALDKVGDDVAQKQLEDAILNGNISYVITQRTTKGFLIKLNQAAPEDISFSWVALSVKDAKVSGQNLAPIPPPAATQSAAFQSILNQLNNSPGNGGGG
jgi:hypothetical protein